MKIFGDFDDERKRNMFIYGLPLTDDEIRELAPSLIYSTGIILGIIVVSLIVYNLLK
jgi:hypothetical protein